MLITRCPFVLTINSSSDVLRVNGQAKRPPGEAQMMLDSLQTVLADYRSANGPICKVEHVYMIGQHRPFMPSYHLLITALIKAAVMQYCSKS